MQPALISQWPTRYRYPFAHERRLRTLILGGQRAEALRVFETLWGCLRENCPTMLHLKSDAIHYVVFLIRKCIQADMGVDALKDSVLTYSTRVIDAASPTEVREVLLAMTEQLLKLAGQRQVCGRQEKVHQAIQYIEAHSRVALSLSDVSRVVGLSYSYFSRLFSRETGVSFQEYLTRVRMENAKELLMTCNLTVEAIADQVGYEDVSHFIRVFKRCTGVTPRRFSQ